MGSEFGVRKDVVRRGRRVKPVFAGFGRSGANGAEDMQNRAAAFRAQLDAAQGALLFAKGHLAWNTARTWASSFDRDRRRLANRAHLRIHRDNLALLSGSALRILL